MRRGVTIVELMIVTILLSLVLTAVWHIFSGARRSAGEIVENHSLNDDLQRLVNILTRDIRKSNLVHENLPPRINPGNEDSLPTNSPNNRLKLTKVFYDFSKDFANLAPDELHYTQAEILYFLEGTADPGQPGPPWSLIRETTPIDDRGNRQDASKTSLTLLENIDELVFYRLNNPISPRSGNVYFRIRFTRTDKDGDTPARYTAGVLAAAKERGTIPQ